MGKGNIVIVVDHFNHRTYIFIAQVNSVNDREADVTLLVPLNVDATHLTGAANPIDLECVFTVDEFIQRYSWSREKIVSSIFEYNGKRAMV